MSALLERAPGRLWSLWDMLRVFAHHYLDIGEHVQNIKMIFANAEGAFEDASFKMIDESDISHVSDALQKLLIHCEALDLSVSTELIKMRLHTPPLTGGEFGVLVDAVYSELKSKLFLFVRPHLAKFYDNHNILSDKATLAFPSCRSELWDASNSLVAGLWTAAVFHSMRAAEIGVRILARELGVSFPDKTIEQAEWANLLDQAETKIKAIDQLPKTDERNRDQVFYSTSASQFRYFKNGWRVRVAHAKATYGEDEAIKIFEHTRDFFETLAERLKE